MMTELPGPGLTAEQWRQIKALVQALSPRQTFWVSGYFNGVGEAAHWIAAQMAMAIAAPAGTSPRRTLTILVGCEAAASATLTSALKKATDATGLAVVVIDMAAYTLARLRDEQDVLVVTHTSDADPPAPATTFFAFLAARRASRLPGMRYAVFSLGAASDERYREAGPWLDRRLEELGATRLLPCVDCDIGAAKRAAGRGPPAPRPCVPWSPPKRRRASQRGV